MHRLIDRGFTISRTATWFAAHKIIWQIIY
jgi:hypothetical protein